MRKSKGPYYLSEVDAYANSIYCMHDNMGENNIEAHTHKKGQFLYTEGGVVYVTTDERTFFLPARHYMWIAPGTRHSIRRGSTGVIMRNLYFPVEKAEPAFFKQSAIYPVNDLLLQMILYSTRWNKDIFTKDKTSYRFALALKSILPEISQYELALTLPFAKDERLQKIVQYMKLHLHESIVFSRLASQFGFSERSLARLFQADISMPFIKYLTLQRMIQALVLLQQKKLSVKEVAAQVGYNSIPSFSSSFYKITGIRPSEYANIKGVLD